MKSLTKKKAEKFIPLASMSYPETLAYNFFVSEKKSFLENPF